MLFNGEHVCMGSTPSYDVAVDSIYDGSVTAAGRMDALSVIVVSDADSMSGLSALFYVNQIVTGPERRGVFDLDRPIADTTSSPSLQPRACAPKTIRLVLYRPRHADFLAERINVSRPDSRSDICVGTEGPESIVTIGALVAGAKRTAGLIHTSIVLRLTLPVGNQCDVRQRAARQNGYDSPYHLVMRWSAYTRRIVPGTGHGHRHRLS